MGTYSFAEYLEMFGGMPEPGETYPDDPDALRDRLKEDEGFRELERERDLEARDDELAQS